ncbi:MaoC family dehydratase [Sphingobium mellinum]|uniref:MaoC family dehydratase n=1 Tax=Sphingobium mellinum TaxID=1387166 RepID=UPI0030ED6961
MTTPYYFEDMKIGDILRFGPLTLERDSLIAFAREYDPQPFHLSDEAAAATHFGSLAASGWQVTALFMKMFLAELRKVPGAQEASLGAIGIDELRWLRPVRAGDTLGGTSEVIEKKASRSRPEMGIVKSRVTLRNQLDEIVMTMLPITMVRTRPA